MNKHVLFLLAILPATLLTAAAQVQEPAAQYCATRTADLECGIETMEPDPQNTGLTVTIPVFFHVVLSTSGGQGDVTMTQITDQIDILNQAFAVGSTSPSRRMGASRRTRSR